MNILAQTIRTATLLPAYLRTRTFLLAFLASYLWFFIFHSFSLLPLFVKASGGSDFQVGVVMGAFSFAALVMRPLSGVSIDALGYKTAALVASVLFVFVLAMFQWTQPVDPLVAILRAGMGLSWVFIVTSLMALSLSGVSAANRSEAIALYGLAGLFAQSSAPLLCEKLVPYVGYALFCRVDVGIAVCATMITMWIPNSKSERATEDFQWKIPKSLFPTLFIVAAYAATRMTAFHFMAPFSSEKNLGAFGLYFLVFTMSAIVVQWKFAQSIDSFGSAKVIPFAALVLALHSFVLAISTSSAMVACAAGLGGVGQGFLYPALNAEIVKALDARRTAFSLSTYAFVFDLGAMLGLPLFGLLADFAGYRIMFMCCALLLCVAVWFEQRKTTKMFGL